MQYLLGNQIEDRETIKKLPAIHHLLSLTFIRKAIDIEDGDKLNFTN